MIMDIEVNGGVANMTVAFAEQVGRVDVDAMAEFVADAMKKHDRINLLLDFNQTQSFDVSAATSIQGAIVSAKSIGPIERYAVVGAPAIADAAIETFGTLLPLEARTFDAPQLEQARDWAFRS